VKKWFYGYLKDTAIVWGTGVRAKRSLGKWGGKVRGAKGPPTSASKGSEQAPGGTSILWKEKAKESPGEIKKTGQSIRVTVLHLERRKKTQTGKKQYLFGKTLTKKGVVEYQLKKKVLNKKTGKPGALEDQRWNPGVERRGTARTPRDVESVISIVTGGVRDIKNGFFQKPCLGGKAKKGKKKGAWKYGSHNTRRITRLKRKNRWRVVQGGCRPRQRKRRAWGRTDNDFQHRQRSCRKTMNIAKPKLQIGTMGVWAEECREKKTRRCVTGGRVEVGAR